MTINEFFDKYQGKGIDFDGSYGFQCMDLYRQYCKEVLEVPQSPPVEGAKDVWTTYLKDHFTQIKNTPTGVPVLGDIIIWDTSVGKYGHIAVFRDGDENGFASFDQNWPLSVDSKGNGTGVCHFQAHNYTGVLGWLRPKEIPTVVPADPDKVKVDLGDFGILEVGAIKSTIADLRRDLENSNKKYDGFVQKWVQEWNLPTASSMVEVENEMSRLLSLEDQVQKFRGAIEGTVGAFDSDQALLTALSAVRDEIKSKSDLIADLQNKLKDANISGYNYVKSWDIYSLRFKLYRKAVS
jgi:hypothetical protein